MIRHQILSVRMSTRLVLRIGCFVFGCLFRAVTMQGENLRFASVRIWKRTQTTQTRAFRPQQRVALASPRLASCSRSRFGVALKISQSPIAAPKRLRSRSPKATATSCASEASICVICGFPNQSGDVASPSFKSLQRQSGKEKEV